MLLEQHQKWAKGIAIREHRKLPKSFQLDDLIQEALSETYKRAKAYDPAKCGKFQAYAYLAVRGAVLMSVRRKNWKEATAEELISESWDTETETPNGEVAQAVQRMSEENAQRSISKQREQWREIRRKALLRTKLSRLSPEHAAIVRSVLIDGESIADTAQALGMDKRTLSLTLRKAVAAMQGHSGEMSRGCKALLKALKDSAGRVMTQTELAQVFGKTPRTIKRQIRELKARGLLRVRRIQNGNTYKVKD